MPIPSSQLAARRSLLGPLVVVDDLLRQTAGPQPVDEHPLLAATPAGVLVHTDDVDAALRHDALSDSAIPRLLRRRRSSWPGSTAGPTRRGCQLPRRCRRPLRSPRVLSPEGSPMRDIPVW